MMEKTLYLTSVDYISFEPIRKIKSYDWIEISQDKMLAAKVDLPVDVSDLDFIEGSTRTTLYLVNRFGDQTEGFLDLSAFPLHVHASVLKLGDDTLPESYDDLVNLAWAELYDNFEDANNYLREWNLATST